MTHHTCVDCQMGFIAKGLEEAEEDYTKMTVEERRKIAYPEGLAYAKNCPYCGSSVIEER